MNRPKKISGRYQVYLNLEAWKRRNAESKDHGGFWQAIRNGCFSEDADWTPNTYKTIRSLPAR